MQKFRFMQKSIDLMRRQHEEYFKYMQINSDLMQQLPIGVKFMQMSCDSCEEYQMICQVKKSLILCK